MPRLRLPISISIIASVGFFLFGLTGCTNEIDRGDVEFACDSDDDCATGFECRERPDGVHVCTQDGHWDDGDVGPDTDSADECVCDPRQNQDYTCDGELCEYFCVDGYASCTAEDGCETDITTVDDCGECGNGCDFDVDVPNATASCDGGECMAICDVGWNSDDGQFATGCECSTTDDPTELPKCDALYVSFEGNDGNIGNQPDAPLETLDRAVAVALTQGYSYILLESTEDTQSFESSEVVVGAVNIIGGLDPESGWRREDPDARTTIVDGSDEPFKAMATTMVIDRSEDDTPQAPMVLANLDIEPPDTPQETGSSVVTLRVEGTEEGGLTVLDSTIVGGQASHGANGSSGQAGAPGEPGTLWELPNGSSNLSELDLPQDGGEGGDAGCSSAGAGGAGGGVAAANWGAQSPGSNPDGDDGGSSDWASGGDGGDGGQNDFIQEQGSSPDYTNERYPGNGTEGSSGAAGAIGQLPDGAGELPAGFLDGEGHWIALLSTSGIAGESGSGGGGGGAGGSNVWSDTENPGHPGHGGGGGGCGGTAGEAGGPGGSTFAVLLINGTADFSSDVDIGVGQAGDGGDGGDAACGGTGGSGAGEPVDDDPEAGTQPGPSGAGADGGPGGAGGAGAGGVGGWSIGIGLAGTSQVDDVSELVDTQETTQRLGGSGGDNVEHCDDGLVPDDGGPTAPAGQIHEVYSF